MQFNKAWEMLGYSSILRYLWSYHLSCFIISENLWRVSGKQEKSRSLKKEEEDGARKARELCLEHCKLNFFPWKNPVVNKQTKLL